jgi:hypothetical protein
MRALILTSTPASKLPVPQLAEEQIVAGPDWPDAQDLEGRWISLRAPTGFHELDIILSKIPEDQWPDRIMILHESDESTLGQIEVYDASLGACG